MKTLFCLLSACILLQPKAHAYLPVSPSFPYSFSLPGFQEYTYSNRIYYSHSLPGSNGLPDFSGVLPTKSFFRLGDQLIALERYRGAGRSYVLVNLHSNESALSGAGLKFAIKSGAAFYCLQPRAGRNVEAHLFERRVSFDPGHIFSVLGRKTTLKSNRCWDKLVNQHVQAFAHFLEKEVVQEKTVVAISRTGDHQTIGDYMNKGRLSRAVKEAYVNAAMDPRDYVLTTEEAVFEGLKEKQMNVVLVVRGRVKDDGSLGIYCARAKRAYVAVNTADGHISELYRMLVGVGAILE